MKHLVKLQQPHDYHYRGLVVHVNPDDVSSVKWENGHALVILKDKTWIYCEQSQEEVVALINEALS